MKLLHVTLRTHQSRIDCLADRLLYDAQGSRLFLVSLLGSDSAVRAILSGLSGHSYLEAKVDGAWVSLYPDVRGGKSIRARLAESSGRNGSRLRGAAGRSARTLTHGAWICNKALVAASGPLGQEAVTMPACEEPEICLIDPTPQRFLALLSSRFVAPALPEWTDWIVARLKEDGHLSDLDAVGTSGCLLRATESEIDELICQGVRSGALKF